MFLILFVYLFKINFCVFIKFYEYIEFIISHDERPGRFKGHIRS